MIVVGLTGGIGAGKSTVSAALAERGAVVIDADAITRELQQPGTAGVRRHGRALRAGIVAADGTLDRQAVADIVFPDPAALADLNAIVHPAVGAEIADAARRRRRAPITSSILDVPLLVETGRDDMAGHDRGRLSTPRSPSRRLVEHRGFTEADARARIARQASRARTGSPRPTS